MSDDMGTFRTAVELEHHVHRGRLVAVRDVLVDTGAEATWISRAVLNQLGVQVERTEMYQMADGRVLTRDVGFVIVHVAGRATTDEVVFALDADLTILGARSMEGLNLRIDPRTKQLVSAGPIVAAMAT
ncbi:MAG: retroviral-like aspartic protease family protein [Gemmatimonadaceae bacterium]